MQEENENRCPNQPTPPPHDHCHQQESPLLADVIRENLNYQLDQSVKRTLFKESMMIDK